MNSFPRIVLSNTDTFSYACRRTHTYNSIARNDILILVKQNENIVGDILFFIPLQGLIAEIYPITAITKWRKSFYKLPKIRRTKILEISDWIESRNSKLSSIIENRNISFQELKSILAP